MQIFRLPILNRRVGAAVVASMLALLTACGSAAKLPAGTYEGTGQGYAKDAPVRLSLTIDESGDIYEIRLLEHHETAEIGGKALDKLVEQAVSDNTIETDTISGATRTSEGFRDALKAAVKAAQESSDSE